MAKMRLGTEVPELRRLFPQIPYTTLRDWKKAACADSCINTNTNTDSELGTLVKAEIAIAPPTPIERGRDRKQARIESNQPTMDEVLAHLKNLMLGADRDSDKISAAMAIARIWQIKYNSSVNWDDPDGTRAADLAAYEQEAAAQSAAELDRRIREATQAS